MYEIKLIKKIGNFTVKHVEKTIVLKKLTNNIKVVKKQNKISLTKRQNEITLQQTGRRGLQGEPGLGLPAGGLPGQSLIKNSNEDYDTTWASSTGGDKNYIQNFTMQHTLNINHNLQKYPSATVINSAGDKVESTVEYVDINNVILQFTAPFSGMVTLN